jgi:hypothetical protein
MKIKHLEEHNISYFLHLKRSLGFSCKSLIATIYFFIHAFAPFIFVKHGSNKIKELYEEVK